MEGSQNRGKCDPPVVRITTSCRALYSSCCGTITAISIMFTLAAQSPWSLLVPRLGLIIYSKKYLLAVLIVSLLTLVEILSRRDFYWASVMGNSLVRVTERLLQQKCQSCSAVIGISFRGQEPWKGRFSWPFDSIKSKTSAQLIFNFCKTQPLIH